MTDPWLKRAEDTAEILADTAPPCPECGAVPFICVDYSLPIDEHGFSLIHQPDHKDACPQADVPGFTLNILDNPKD